ncbi:hypothetical protein CR205_12280 [Alteribacter lacisalsi]|uniref:Uncharacterized protein n=1 Tax=Alteribacter lacisalsi TaxID=2045244 RepID=A0A2W0H696_9BACI|nr:hypothetical protein [Alteribacter lacisalsi]PYZ96491.1 hypothetical protein CR205_12280 [Alteribacter lacisalsi]
MREQIAALVQEAVKDFFRGSGQKARRRNVLVLLDYESLNPAQVHAHLKALTAQHNVTMYAGESWRQSFPEARALEEAGRKELTEAAEAEEVVYIPVASHGFLAKLALTIDDEPIAETAIALQLAGRTFLVADDDLVLRSYRRLFARPAVEKRITGYMRQAREDGAVFTNLDKAVQRLGAMKPHEPKRPLVLASHVEEAERNGETELVVPEKTLVTPMGRDRARELGVAIRKEGDPS